MGNKNLKKQKRQITNHDLSQRAKQSYGLWTQLAWFMTQLGFLSLQALDRYMYRFAIARVQTTLTLGDPAYFFYY